MIRITITFFWLNSNCLSCARSAVSSYLSVKQYVSSLTEWASTASSSVSLISDFWNRRHPRLFHQDCSLMSKLYVPCCCSNVTYLDNAYDADKKRSLLSWNNTSKRKRHKRAFIYDVQLIYFCSTAANKVYGVVMCGIYWYQKNTAVLNVKVLYIAGLLNTVWRYSLSVHFPSSTIHVALCILLYD